MTTAALEGLTPGGLDGLSAQADGTPSDSIGKIITSSGWYFSCNLTEQEAEDLYAGASVTPALPGHGAQLPCHRQAGQRSGGRPGERHVLRLRLRRPGGGAAGAGGHRCHGDGHRLPGTQARRARQSDEALDSAGQLGVYRVSGAQAKWVPVNIIWEEDDFYLVTQAYDYETDENGKTTQVAQSEFDKASNLRAGDTIIVRGENIYNGKVVTD